MVLCPRFVRVSPICFQGVAALDAGRAAGAVERLERSVSKVVRKDGVDGRVRHDRPALASAKERTGDLAGAAEDLKRIIETPGDRLSFEGALGPARFEDKLGRAADLPVQANNPSMKKEGSPPLRDRGGPDGLLSSFPSHGC